MTPHRYTAVENWLREQIGLDVSSVGPSTVARALQSRMAARQQGDVSAYAEALAHSSAEAQALIEAIVVPETSFFRDRHPFVALKEWALQSWVPSHPSGVMRLLSMPCSTGEEPYSMAMALMEEGVARFLVEGVDISQMALAKAERGLYRRNSFRGDHREAMQAHFTSEEPGKWKVAAQVKEHVRFQQANLLDPAFGEHRPLYDVIFCRNLLIYLDAAAQRKVMAKIESLLAPKGLLCVGHAEAYLFSQYGFEASGAPMAFCFHKRGAASGLLKRSSLKPGLLQGKVVPLPVKKAASSSVSLAAQALRSPELPRVTPPLAPVPSLPLPFMPPTGAPTPPLELDECERMANAGAFAQAEALGRASIELAGPSARAFYLLALICDAQGRLDEAAALYRKTLYLEPEHLEALAHLALFLRKQGDTRGAEQFQRRLLRVEKQGCLRV